jgi:hypothetical protein
MSQLSPFQQQCSSELKRLLLHASYAISRWNIVKGRGETYVEADVGPLKLWIYDDGACWQGVGRDRVYEAVDYDSLDDLQRAFLADVAALLTPGAQRRGNQT